MAIALKKTEATATELGNKSNTIWSVKSIDGICRHTDGTNYWFTANVITEVRETRAKFDNCDPALMTAGVNHRYDIQTANDTELTMAEVLVQVKAAMEAEGFTMTDEV